MVPPRAAQQRAVPGGRRVPPDRLLSGTQVALDAVRLAAPGRVLAFYDALDRLDRALRGVPAADRGRQGERFHAPATIEARLAEVERLVGGMSDHLAALDQRVAGLGNGLDEVRAGVRAPGEFDARPSGDR